MALNPDRLTNLVNIVERENSSKSTYFSLLVSQWAARSEERRGDATGEATGGEWQGDASGEQCGAGTSRVCGAGTGQQCGAGMGWPREVAERLLEGSEEWPLKGSMQRLEEGSEVQKPVGCEERRLEGCEALALVCVNYMARALVVTDVERTYCLARLQAFSRAGRVVGCGREQREQSEWREWSERREARGQTLVLTYTNTRTWPCEMGDAGLRLPQGIFWPTGMVRRPDGVNRHPPPWPWIGEEHLFSSTGPLAPPSPPSHPHHELIGYWTLVMLVLRVTGRWSSESESAK